MYARGFLLGFIAIFLGDCEPSGNSSQSDTAQYTADIDLLHDAARARPILASRLRENLKLEGNIIVVEGSRANGAFAMSKNTAWTVSCGTGLTVYLDKAEIDLVSVQIQLDDRECATLTAQTGSAVRAIIGGPETTGNSKWGTSRLSKKS